MILGSLHPTIVHVVGKRPKPLALYTSSPCLRHDDDPTATRAPAMSVTSDMFSSRVLEHERPPQYPAHHTLAPHTAHSRRTPHTPRTAPMMKALLS